MPEPLCLLTVHAHPDDEASKGAPTCARYAAAGVTTVLVCCTGGEEGEILNPAMDTPENRADIGALRRVELERAAEAIGFTEVVMLGYRDSGMPDTEANANPDAFANAPFDEALERLVAVIRRTRPQVLLTYGPDHRGYPHPDHIRVHELTMAAFDAAADSECFVAAGPPWQPLKLYYSVWARERFEATHHKMLELGLESPYDEKWWKRRDGRADDVITTHVDVRATFGVRRRALLAHATQIDPTSSFWFGLPDDVARDVYPYEDWALARSLVGGPSLESGVTTSPAVPEDDLFAGVADAATAIAVTAASDGGVR